MQNKSLGSIAIPGKTKQKFETHTRTLIPITQKKHNIERTKTLFVRNNKLLLLFGLAVIIILWIYFIPPVNILTVGPIIILLTVFVILLTDFNKKLQIFSTIFTLVLLTLSYTVGFDLISTTILLSFIIVLSTLFKIE